jgi:hypothetical protein
MKCIACGSAALIEGIVMPSNGGSIGFYPRDSPVLKRIFGMGSREIRAYGCIHCQNLQFAVGFNESDLERYQEFEGEQPDVLARINSNAKDVEEPND